MRLMILAFVTLLFATGTAFAKCETVIVNGKPVQVCDQRQLKGADCWRIGPIQHCDYRPDPWDP